MLSLQINFLCVVRHEKPARQFVVKDLNDFSILDENRTVGDRLGGNRVNDGVLEKDSFGLRKTAANNQANHKQLFEIANHKS
jgi:hypothetical protein